MGIVVEGSDSVLAFFTDWDVPAHNPAHDLPLPTVTTNAGTLIGDLLIVQMLVRTNDSLGAPPTKAGWVLEDIANITDFTSGFGHTDTCMMMVWSKVSDVDGATLYDFTDVYHQFTGVAFYSFAINKIQLSVWIRGNAVSWNGGMTLLPLDWSPGTGNADVVTGVGGAPNLTLNFNNGDGSLEGRGAEVVNFDIAPSDVSTHLNIVFAQTAVAQLESALVTIDPDYTVLSNGSDGGNANFYSPAPVTPVATWPLGPLGWSAEGTVATPAQPAVNTVRFDEGLGSSWYLIPPLTDSGNELRSKVVKSMRATGRLTNASMKAYAYDINDEIVVADLEAGTNATTRAQDLPDSTQVAQSPRKQINAKNAVLHTVRIEGDDTGNTERDEVHELAIEVADEGVRR